MKKIAFKLFILAALCGAYAFTSTPKASAILPPGYCNPTCPNGYTCMPQVVHGHLIWSCVKG